MPVLGAVLQLAPEVDPQAFAEVLAEDPRITLGDPSDDRLPVVLATDSRAEDRALWEAVVTSEAVAMAHLVYADFSDLSPDPEVAL